MLRDMSHEISTTLADLFVRTESTNFLLKGRAIHWNMFEITRRHIPAVDSNGGHLDPQLPVISIVPSQPWLRNQKSFNCHLNKKMKVNGTVIFSCITPKEKKRINLQHCSVLYWVNKFQPRRRLLSLLASVLDAAREAVFFTLTIPSLNPSIRTHGSEDFLEVITRGIVFTLDFLASMEVQVALVTVPEKFFQ